MAEPRQDEACGQRYKHYPESSELKERLTSYPGVSFAFNTYENLKTSNRLLELSLGTAESAVSSLSLPLVEKLHLEKAGLAVLDQVEGSMESGKSLAKSVVLAPANLVLDVTENLVDAVLPDKCAENETEEGNKKAERLASAGSFDRARALAKEIPRRLSQNLPSAVTAPAEQVVSLLELIYDPVHLMSVVRTTTLNKVSYGAEYVARNALDPVKQIVLDISHRASELDSVRWAITFTASFVHAAHLTRRWLVICVDVASRQSLDYVASLASSLVPTRVASLFGYVRHLGEQVLTRVLSKPVTTNDELLQELETLTHEVVEAFVAMTPQELQNIAVNLLARSRDSVASLISVIEKYTPPTLLSFISRLPGYSKFRRLTRVGIELETKAQEKTSEKPRPKVLERRKENHPKPPLRPTSDQDTRILEGELQSVLASVYATGLVEQTTSTVLHDFQAQFADLVNERAEAALLEESETAAAEGIHAELQAELEIASETQAAKELAEEAAMRREEEEMERIVREEIETQELAARITQELAFETQLQKAEEEARATEFEEQTKLEAMYELAEEMEVEAEIERVLEEKKETQTAEKVMELERRTMTKMEIETKTTIIDHSLHEEIIHEDSPTASITDISDDSGCKEVDTEDEVLEKSFDKNDTTPSKSKSNFRKQTVIGS